MGPSSEVLEGYRSVTARTAGGEPTAGLLKNADTFSIQILRRDGTYSLLDRREVTELTAEEDSVMPADYEQRLSGHQLQNLLAFLDRQRDAFVTIVRGFQNY